MNFPLKSHQTAKVAIDEQARQAKGSLQWLLEDRPTIPVTRGNTLDFMICGEDGFKSIAKDLREARSSVDLVCWGFDPGMELERTAGEWPRGKTYGQLLEEISSRKDNPVTVRLLIWSTPRGSALQNNMPGFSDVQQSWTSGPVMHHLRQVSPYGEGDDERHKWCAAWWAKHLPGGRSNAGVNPHLRVVLREVSAADATALRDVYPGEKDAAYSSTFSLTDEKSQLEQYATHHQKPILIDYDWDSGSKAVGYVMGLNSVTDYWDTTAHLVDDPKREVLTSDTIKDELQRERDTQGAVGTAGKESYHRGRPFQDYACRVVGPALAQLHYNFENGWAAALGHTMPYIVPPKPLSKIKTVAGNPAHLVQIVRTQPHERDKSIKEVYFQASSSAHNYIYIENQYFFYPEFARNLISHRKKFCEEWAAKAKKPISEAPRLHLFIVIPHPERAEMVPRTFDTLTELGAQDSMPEQAHLSDRGKLDQRYPDSHKGPKGGQVLDRHSVDEMQQTLGLEVSVARLRSSGADANHDMAYREIYIHSKLMVIDDVFITVGSANLNQRSMSFDSEINIAATGQLYAAHLRQRVFDLHSGGEVQGSGDPKEIPATFKYWNMHMKDNLSAMKNGNAMTGFLLPFEDHRSTTTLYGMNSVPNADDTALA